LTVREVVRELGIARDREERAATRDVTLAWTTVRLYAEWRTKKLPALADLLPKAGAAPTPARPYGQTIAEQRTMLDVLARRHGGRVREVRA